MYPRIIADLDQLRENMERMIALCHGQGLTAALVSKCVCADARIAAVMAETGADFLADSRVQNLARLPRSKPRYLLRVAQPSEVDDVVCHAEVSQQSEPYTVRLLGDAAARQGRRHKVVLMIDMGDLREGVPFFDMEGVHALAEAVIACPALELYGVGVNMTCFGGVLPSQENLSGLVRIADGLRRRYGLPIPFVSGGNSSALTMLREGTIPKGITNLRIGEGWLLGNDTGALKPMEGFHSGCFTLEAQLVEVKRKPSKPIGDCGANAFGEKVEFEDRGEMLRGICAIGRQDVEPGGLTPQDARVEILGASSDHLIVNLTEAPGYRVGDVLSFNLDYGALLHVYTSEYVFKAYRTAAPFIG